MPRFFLTTRLPFKGALQCFRRWKGVSARFSAAPVLCVLLMLFLFCGALFSRALNTGAFDALYTSLFYDVFTQRSLNVGFFRFFLSSCFLSFTCILVCMLFGLSVWGSVAVPFLVAVRGFLYGMTLGLEYIYGGVSGFLGNLLICAPKSLVCIAVLCAAASDSMHASRQLSNVLGQSSQQSFSLQKYCIRFCAYLLITVLAVLLEWLLGYLFAGYFYGS